MVLDMRSSQKWVRSVTVKSFEKVLRTGLSRLAGLTGPTGLTVTQTILIKTETMNYSLTDSPDLEMLAHQKIFDCIVCVYVFVYFDIGFNDIMCKVGRGSKYQRSKYQYSKYQ